MTVDPAPATGPARKPDASDDADAIDPSTGAAATSAGARSDVIERATEALRHFFGFPRFRDGQVPVIQAVLENENCLVVMPTGAGKSLCYQLPALVRQGLTLVVSPLIALMKDQVDALRERDLPAAFINSTQSRDEQDAVLERVRRGDVQLLYVAPERLRAHAFRDGLGNTTVRCFAVDEAHCISQWGHDFRPDYARLRQALEWMKPRQVLGFTATATPEVRGDIAEQLGVPLREIVGGFTRPNLNLAVKRVRSRQQKLDAIKETLAETLAEGGSAIIYCSTRRAVERAASALRETSLPIAGPHRPGASADMRVAIYHGGLDDDDRRRAQDAFMSGRTPVIVATNAFGMGVDKPDIRAVIHHDITGSIEAYYQEAGRAGRDGDPARCLLCYSPIDLRVQEFFLEGENPAPEVIRGVWEALLEVGRPVVEETRASLARRTRPDGGEVSDISEIAVSTALRLLERSRYLTRRFDHVPQGFFRVPEEPVNRAGQSALQSRRSRRSRWHGLAPSRRKLLDHVVEHQQATGQLGLQATAGELAHTLRYTENTLQTAIRELTQAGELVYDPPFRGRAVQIVKRVQASELELDWEWLAKKAASARDKLDRMIDYVESMSCRHRLLVEHFGEQVEEDCADHCDNCERGGAGGPANRVDVLPDDACDAAFEILALAAALGGRFGRRVLGRVLSGARDKKLLGWKLDRNPAHGKLAHHSVDTVNAAVDALLDAGLLQTYSKGDDRTYRLCRISSDGRRCLSDRNASGLPHVPAIAALSIAPPTTPEPHTSAKPKPDAATTTDATPEGTLSLSAAELATRLKALRLELSAGKPAYRVFPNKVLDEIIRRRPRTLDQLHAIPGMGPKRISEHGDAILATVAGTELRADAAPEPESAKRETRKRVRDKDEPGDTASALGKPPRSRRVAETVPPAPPPPLEEPSDSHVPIDDIADDRPPGDYLESLEPPPLFDGEGAPPPEPLEPESLAALLGPQHQRSVVRSGSQSDRRLEHAGRLPDPMPDDHDLARTYTLQWLGFGPDAIARARGLTVDEVRRQLAELVRQGFAAE